MPVGTYGTVKGMTPEEVKETGAQILLGKHLPPVAAPGQEIMKLHGDLRLHAVAWADPHRLRRFRVFSTGAMRKIKEEGVYFRNPINGDKVFLSPEKSMEIQYDWVPTS